MRCTIRVLAACGALAAAAMPATAMAGDYSYTVTQTLSTDTTGWAFSGASGFAGCSPSNGAGACSAVTSPRPLAVVGDGAAAANTSGEWDLTIPQGLYLNSGSVSVYWSTATSGTSAYLKTASPFQNFATQPQQYSATGAKSATWPIVFGTQKLGVGLNTSKAAQYSASALNQVRIGKVQLTFQDYLAPSVSASVTPPASGWFDTGSQVCVNATASDPGSGSGVTKLNLVNASGTVLASFTPAAQSVFRPGAANVTQSLCTAASKLSQGIQTLDVVAMDAAGNSTFSNAVSVQVGAAVGPVISGTGALVSGLGLSGPQNVCGLVTVTDATAAVPEVDIYSDGKFVSSFVGPASPGATVTHNVCAVPNTLGSNGSHALLIRATDANRVTGAYTAGLNIDPTAGPLFTADGPLISSPLGTAPACFTVNASNTGSGITSMWVGDGAGVNIGNYTANSTASAVSHTFCIDPATMRPGKYITVIVDGGNGSTLKVIPIVGKPGW